MTGDKTPTINQEIGQTADLSQAELVASWRSMLVAPRPKGIGRVLLKRASAIRIRMRANGDAPSMARERFLAIAGKGKVAKPIPPEHHDVPSASQHRNITTFNPGAVASQKAHSGLRRHCIEPAGD